MSEQNFTLAVVSAGASDPSSTRMLADRISARTAELAAGRGNTVTTIVIELRDFAADITSALVSQLVTPTLQRAITALGEADGVVASTPVYKAGPSGLFTSFFQILDNDLLIAKPVVLAATAGTTRHALVADGQMRPMFAYLRAMTTPTALFAAPEDWADPALNTRVDRAATELVLLMERLCSLGGEDHTPQTPRLRRVSPLRIRLAPRSSLTLAAGSHCGHWAVAGVKTGRWAFTPNDGDLQMNTRAGPWPVFATHVYGRS